MDNRTYGVTDYPHTSQSPQITSADTLPDQTNTTDASITGAAVYDTVASEDTAAEEAVYSALVGGTAGTASENVYQYENTGKKNSVSSEMHLDTAPIYHVLESGDCHMEGLN